MGSNHSCYNFTDTMVEEVEQHWDCLIIGAGISGLDAAYHLKVSKVACYRSLFLSCHRVSILGLSENNKLAL